MNTQVIDETTNPIRVWDVPTRVFHWLLAASFAGAWLTAESERWRDLHVMLGYTLAGLIVFRVFWGLAGSRYARFSSFVFPPRRVLSYLKSLFSGAPEHHVGHNPAGALAIFLLLGLGLLVAGSGLATYQELGGEWVEDLHEGAANTMLAVVAFHLAGVLVSSLLHRENLARAMITGLKRGKAGEGIAGSAWPMGLVLLAAVLGFWAADRSGWIGDGATAGGSGKMAAERSATAGEGEPDGRRGRNRRDDD